MDILVTGLWLESIALEFLPHRPQAVAELREFVAGYETGILEGGSVSYTALNVGVNQAPIESE
jgi:hypothetical protein